MNLTTQPVYASSSAVEFTKRNAMLLRGILIVIVFVAIATAAVVVVSPSTHCTFCAYSYASAFRVAEVYFPLFDLHVKLYNAHHLYVYVKSIKSFHQHNITKCFAKAISHAIETNGKLNEEQIVSADRRSYRMP